MDKLDTADRKVRRDFVAALPLRSIACSSLQYVVLTDLVVGINNKNKKDAENELIFQRFWPKKRSPKIQKKKPNSTIPVIADVDVLRTSTCR